VAGTRPGTAKDRALEYVKAQVLTGAFPGGELISEGDVAAALGMSRTPVREAFLRLEAEGLLRLYPQRGALVVPVSPDEARAVIEARLALERFATTKVIGRGAAACAAVYERLSGELTRQRDAEAANDWREFLDADRAFHAVILDESQNVIMAGFYSSLRDRQMRMIAESALGDPNRTATIIGQHREIAEAVGAGDLPTALHAVAAHLASTAGAIGLALDPSGL
jgi:DNA-binding GntR family transcriptional regulator